MPLVVAARSSEDNAALRLYPSGLYRNSPSVRQTLDALTQEGYAQAEVDVLIAHGVGPDQRVYTAPWFREVLRRIASRQRLARPLLRRLRARTLDYETVYELGGADALEAAMRAAGCP